MMMHSKFLTDMHEHAIPVCRKNWKFVGLSIFGWFGWQIALKIVRRYKHHRKVKRRQDEVKKSFAKLEEELTREGLPRAKVDEIVNLPIKELQQKLQKGELKAIEVLRAYQAKAIEVNDKTNSIVEPIKEAESIAKNLDKQTGPKGPLHGIPISIKECYNIKGYEVTAGFSYFLGKPVDNDAPLVVAMVEAGAVPFVRTNIPQTMMTFECGNPIYGITTNPYDSKRGPGGSSGGEGALIGGGGSILGLGGDIGGSIRIPCNMCGIAGIKPTKERLNQKGVLGITKGQTHVPASPGPMARSVDGVVLAMKALLDKPLFTIDPLVPPLKFDTQAYESKRPLRIGFYINNKIIAPVPACVRAVNEAKQALEKQGHTFVPFLPPDIHWALSRLYINTAFADKGSVAASYLKYDVIDDSYWLTYHTFHTLPLFVRICAGLFFKLQNSFAGEVIMQKEVTTMLEWWGLYEKLSAYKERVIQHWKEQKIDVLLTPGFASPALPTNKGPQVSNGLTYTTIWNLLNFPAGSVPVTKVTEQDQEHLNNKEIYPATDFLERRLRSYCQDGVGLPVNVQCVALPYQEEMVLRVMKEIESSRT